MNELPSSFVVKLTQICNLNCSYCYVYHHEDQSFSRLPKFITDEAIANLCANLERHSDAMPTAPHLTFHGGEPLAIGKSRMREILSRIRAVSPEAEFSIQTNGVLLDAEWVAIAREFGAWISISMDGDRASHDRNRVDLAGTGSFDRIVRNIAMLRRLGQPFGLLCVMDPAVSGRRSYEALSSLRPASINFLFPDVTLQSKPAFFPGIVDGDLAAYVIEAFDAWFDDSREVNVGLFRDMVLQLSGASGRTDMFGADSLGYLIYETDGTFEILDALKVCGDGLTKVAPEGDLLGAIRHPAVAAFQTARETSPRGCAGCAYRHECRGGYLPHRFRPETGFDNPSAWCADLKLIWDHVLSRVGEALRTAIG